MPVGGCIGPMGGRKSFTGYMAYSTGYRVQYMVVLAQWGAQERQNWPGAQECETPSYPSSCFKTESEKFNSVLDSILMFVLIL